MSESTAAQAAASTFSITDAVGARVADGGPVLWLLAACSIVVVAIVLVKTLQFVRLRIWHPTMALVVGALVIGAAWLAHRSRSAPRIRRAAGCRSRTRPGRSG